VALHAVPFHRYVGEFVQPRHFVGICPFSDSIRNHNDAFFSSATCRPPKRSGDPSTRPATVPRCLPPVPAQQGPRGLLGESKPLRRACVAYLRAWRALVETNPIAFI
jgi:hypothetical protein